MLAQVVHAVMLDLGLCSSYTQYCDLADVDLVEDIDGRESDVQQ